jgi:dynein regulatory complex protein 1
MSTKKATKKETQREIKERLARDGKHHWERLTQVLSEETFRVWKVLGYLKNKILLNYKN